MLRCAIYVPHTMSKFGFFPATSLTTTIEGHSPTARTSSINSDDDSNHTNCCGRCCKCCFRNDGTSHDIYTVAVSGEYEYVIEKLVVTKIPLILSGRQKDVEKSLVQLATRNANMAKTHDVSQESYCRSPRDISHSQLMPYQTERYITMRSNVEEGQSLNFAEVHCAEIEPQKSGDINLLEGDSISGGPKRGVEHTQINKTNENIKEYRSNDTLTSNIFAMIPCEKTKKTQERERKYARTKIEDEHGDGNMFSEYTVHPSTILGQRSNLAKRKIKGRSSQSERSGDGGQIATATVEGAGPPGANASSASARRSGPGRTASGESAGSGSGSSRSILTKKPSLKSMALSKESDILLEENKLSTGIDSLQKNFYIDVTGRRSPQTGVHTILNKYSSIFVDNLKDPVPKDPLILSHVNNRSGEHSTWSLRESSPRTIANALSEMDSYHFLRPPSTSHRASNSEQALHVGHDSHDGIADHVVDALSDSSASVEQKCHHLDSLSSQFETPSDESIMNVLETDSPYSDIALNASGSRKSNVISQKYINYNQDSKTTLEDPNETYNKFVSRRQNLVHQDISSKELGNVDLSLPQTENINNFSFNTAQILNEDNGLHVADTISRLYRCDADFHVPFVPSTPPVSLRTSSPSTSPSRPAARSDSHCARANYSTQKICKLSEESDTEKSNTPYDGAVKRWKIIIKHCKHPSRDPILRRNPLDGPIRGKR